MAEELFTVTITALHGEDAGMQASRFLAMVFKNRTLGEIARALTNLPLMITSDVSRAAADTLRKHLEARGATVLIESYLAPEEGEAVTCAGQAMTPSVASAPLPAASAPAQHVETSYAYARPGRKDRIHTR